MLAHPSAGTYLEGLPSWNALNCMWKSLIWKVTFYQSSHPKLQTWTVLREKAFWHLNPPEKSMETSEVILFIYFFLYVKDAFFLRVCLIYVCACVAMSMHMYVVECVWTYVHLWRPEMDIRYLLPFVTLCVEEGSLWTWSSLTHLHYLDLKPQGLSCLSLPRPMLLSLAFYVTLRNWIQVLTHAQQTLYQLSHFLGFCVKSSL